MEQYLGVKLISAESMCLGDAEDKLDRAIGAVNANTAENGYLVEYEDGYQSWSPKDVFEKAYRKIKEGVPTENVEFDYQKKSIR